MKKLFVQFYLLLFVCFLVMTMMVGLVYKFTAERAGRQSLDDLMKSSLYLMRSELREIPPRDWSKTLKELDLNLSFDLHIEPISKFKLSENSMQHLRAGISSPSTISTPLSSGSRAATTCSPSVRCPISIFCMRCACSIWP
jgi:two-component system sensor histidine kinase RstB